MDKAFFLFIKAIQTADDDSVQIGWINQFVSGYCQIFYYYQQNQTVFKSLKNYMDELMRIHEQLRSAQCRMENNRHCLELNSYMGKLFCEIYELLQSIQNDCIHQKI